MSFFIKKLPDGKELPVLGKAEFLVRHAGAISLEVPPSGWQKDLVCVLAAKQYDCAFVPESSEDLARCFSPLEERIRLCLLLPDSHKYNIS